MHLKSLTLRGFKSFASATTLEFEPGITCVVGPNGSGKSNVVDAVAWVMGEQGAKSLRGGKMDDVIFAGTSGRPALGRAEVVLTIDNSDGALPIDFSEVTIARTMFRSGGSEYAINGETCRLLDVQELLSDSGIGREMHVIVGQGRLDSILHATPEDRRGFIEEAAGVLKHRKRKEKALRKLDAMSANLTRIQDLTHELRRQLKPLGRQAEVARRAQVIQSDVRDARLRLLADDLLTVNSALEQEQADEAMLRERRAGLENQLNTARQREAAVEAESVEDSPRIQRVNGRHLRLTALRERFAGLINLAAERARHLHEDAQERLSVDPEQLDKQAADAQASYDALAVDVQDLAASLQAAQQVRSSAEDELGRAIAADNHQRAEAGRRRETLLRLEGNVESARSRAESRDAEIARLVVQLAEAQDRLAPLEAALGELGEQGQEMDSSLAELDQRRRAAVARRDSAQAQLAQAQLAAQATELEWAAVAARIDALRMTLATAGGSGAFDPSEVPLLGVISDGVRIEAGWESAIGAALAQVADADAVAVSSVAGAVGALRHLRAKAAGRATVVIAAPVATDGTSTRVGLGAGTRWAADVLRPGGRDGSDRVASEQISSAVANLLAHVVLVDDLDEAQRIVQADGSLMAVTRDGDVLGTAVASGGDAAATRLNVVAALELAERREVEIATEVQSLAAAVVNLDETFNALRAAAKLASDEFAAAGSSAAAHQSQIALAESRIVSANAEAQRISNGLASARTALAQDVELVAAAEARLADFEAEVADAGNVEVAAELTKAAIEELRKSLEAARHGEVDARLAVRTAEERVESFRARAEELRADAAAERDARVRARQQRERRVRQARVAADVLDVAQEAAERLEETLARSDDERLSAESARQGRNEELTTLRGAIRDLATQIEALTNDVHRDEIARAEQRLRVEQLEAKALEEYGVEPAELIAEYGPNVMVPASAIAPGDEVDPSEPPAQPYPYVRSEQEKRLRVAEKSMALLGRVNPLALEEFTAMEERHTFLTAQLDDLKRSRKDLLDIVAEVDERVQQVFSEVFADVQREFVGVFDRLFPGGEGRLVLTDPDDLLMTGVDVEARPAGKKVKRLSLLSGGERSLTAVAFLIALFKARPSPFYLLDEVEAALDDTNLGRLLGCLEELRATSQLLVITHQKRTMEIADSLYGVTMRQGETRVISQRMRELLPV